MHFTKAAFVEGWRCLDMPPITDLDCEKPLIMLPDSGDMVENVRTGAVELSQTGDGSKKALVIRRIRRPLLGDD
jgi:hypothetical protein